MKNLSDTRTLTTYIGEKRLFTLGNECLVSVIRPHTCGKARMLVAVTADGYRTDYPIWYGDASPESREIPGFSRSRIGWDNPEWFTKRFRERAARHIVRFHREVLA